MIFRRVAFVYFAVAALAACSLDSLPGASSTPVAIANKTTLDERALLGAELAYQGSRTAAEIAVDAGILKGASAARVAALDNSAYAALRAARAAYDAGNASSYGTALSKARTAISEALAIMKGPAR